jgi:hypothetical protein
MLGPLSEPLQQSVTLMPRSLEQTDQQMGAAQCIRFGMLPSSRRH